MSHDLLRCKPSYNWSPVVIFTACVIYPVIENLNSSKIRAVILFLHTKDVNAVEMCHELCTAHGQNLMSEDMCNSVFE
jgi:hypothetical protein